MILTQKEILKEIAKKRIKIEPFDKSAVGPASIDLALDKDLRVFNKDNSFVEMKEGVDSTKFADLTDISEGYLLKPGELVLGMTNEKITLPVDICGWLYSRSRFARFGLMLTTPFVSPGSSNRPVLEIFNAGPKVLKLMPGVKICQIVLETCKGVAKYKGKFKSQRL